ncbi:unnamed protein product [Ilex paraguariensis]|uniref:DUF4378 domain-containing protein n=1 Tax=Ilex paraguariensis TaxID=185542 RepID=A0ABC8S0B5_9AQUA
MNHTRDKTASSLAITEKKPHRPGGCVGILFQLFDWNRRFAKKKLFSKKLLPPVRAKQSSKRFGGDEKLPKLRLIADENSGGFPNVMRNGARNSEQKHEMRAPGLVARLMGLESMPPGKQGNSKKTSFSGVGGDKGENFVSYNCGFDREELHLEKEGAKNESRPPKLQKTGLSDRRAVTRFGAEALQLKNVLSRSRKHHPKLASPVKCPRSLSRNASRLIGAATKILEPGLQNMNRAKGALTYSTAMHHASIDDFMLEGRTALSPDPSHNSNYYVSAAKSTKGHSSCRNCGHLLDVVDSRPNVEEQLPVYASYVSNCVNPSPQGLERNVQRPLVSSPEQEREQDIQQDHKHSASLAAQAMDGSRPRGEPISERKPRNQDGQIQGHLTSERCKPKKCAPPSVGIKHNTQRQNQVSPGGDKAPPRSKLSNMQSNRVSSAANATNDTKDFVALNRISSGRTRSRMPAKEDNFKFGAERRIGGWQNDSLSPERKRRLVNVTRKGEISGSVNSTSGKQTSVSYDTRHTNIKSRLTHVGESNRTGGSGNKDNEVISFTFSSPMKHKTGLPTGMEKRREQNDLHCNRTQQKSILDESDGKTSFQKPFPLRGDTLGVLIEQKLKELTSQEEDELAIGGTPPKRTTAMILQELISALTAERPFPQDDVAVGSNQETISVYHGQQTSMNTPLSFQGKPKTARASVGYSHDSDHLSPGSVLDASFSNDSCFSNSRDDSSWHRLHAGSMEWSDAEPEPDADLLDCATSLSIGKSDREFVSDLLNDVGEVLCALNLVDAGLKGIKLTHAKEVILNVELIFINAALAGSDINRDFSVTSFLLDELETLERVIWANFSCILAFEDTKENNQLKAFALDCVIEHLDSSYVRHSSSGYTSWTRLPLSMNAEMLILEVVDGVRRWTDLTRLILDELVEKEMSHSLGKWTDFEIEAFETGAEIDWDILHGLVNEIVIDLWEGNYIQPL